MISSFLRGVFGMADNFSAIRDDYQILDDTKITFYPLLKVQDIVLVLFIHLSIHLHVSVISVHPKPYQVS